ncbi:MAG TPA: VOC family protein [Paucimonas sp.]|nr:VOC family protein [Paucimonas sp.]
MTDPNLILLYVDRPQASTAFYTELLGKEPLESSPTFSMFKLESGVMLGLWSRHTVEPAAAATGGGGELAFTVADDGMVRATYAAWKERGLKIAQEPTTMGFGHTFVALDPDGHRLRVFAPAAM